MTRSSKGWTGGLGALAATALTGLTAVVAVAPDALAWPAEATRELAVREGPGQEYPHIEVVPPGTVVDVQHCNVDRTWCKVAAGGTVGYLRGMYLQRIGDVYLGPRVDYYSGPRVYVVPGRPYYHDYDGPRRYRRY